MFLHPSSVLFKSRKVSNWLVYHSIAQPWLFPGYFAGLGPPRWPGVCNSFVLLPDKMSASAFPPSGVASFFWHFGPFLSIDDFLVDCSPPYLRGTATSATTHSSDPPFRLIGSRHPRLKEPAVNLQALCQ